MRVSGKHNDLETVGRTAKHHTFFEMLGNFSFGDYFKKEAIAFAWELVTGVFRLRQGPALRHHLRGGRGSLPDLGREISAFPSRGSSATARRTIIWSMGETGPCGPCSEIHYDLGADIESGRAVAP